MTQRDQKLDPHSKPPDELKAFYKHYQKLKPKDLDNDTELLDFGRNTETFESKVAKEIDFRLEFASKKTIYEHMNGNDLVNEFLSGCDDVVRAYEHPDMPGLHIIPNLLPQSSQKTLLDRLLHRDVSNPAHQSNLHLHYNVQYPLENASFFSLDLSSDLTQQPKDPSVHKPVGVQQLLNKKLRWITLGGQYDWTNKVYPASKPPIFPPDIAELLQFLFPEMVPQAAIVNFYSPGDTLSLHRDVAEDCSRGLVSISIGCEGIFVLGLESEEGCKSLAVRLKSGDAVFMSGTSRYAWHGVPQIIPNSCPEWLRDWPGAKYEHWQGWMANKRINLNVRQMWD